MKAKYETLQRQQQTTRLNETEQTQRLGQSENAVSVAEAAYELARINLSYTIITAPCNGYTARKTLQAGVLVHQGEELVTIVNNAQSWVLANFRERQMKHITIGKKVKISTRYSGVSGSEYIILSGPGACYFDTNLVDKILSLKDFSNYTFYGTVQDGWSSPTLFVEKID